MAKRRIGEGIHGGGGGTFMGWGKWPHESLRKGEAATETRSRSDRDVAVQRDGRKRPR